MYHIALCDDSEYDLQEISSALKGLEDLGVKYDERWYKSGRELVDDFAEGGVAIICSSWTCSWIPSMASRRRRPFASTTSRCPS